MVFSLFFLYHLFETHVNLSLGYLPSEVTRTFILERSKPLVSFIFLGSVSYINFYYNNNVLMTKRCPTLGLLVLLVYWSIGMRSQNDKVVSGN